MGTVVGIDLGTTFSAVAWINPKTNMPEIIRNSEDEPITPSVVQFLEDGSIICGAKAKEAYEEGVHGCASSFKRFMGTNTVCCISNGQEYTARDLSAILLTHLKKEAELALGQTITDAVITVPAYFYNDEREDTLYAAKKAGLHVLQLIHEPTAAALNYGMKFWRENAVIMVYDLGGGTFDVTLVGMGANHQMESIATEGDKSLGGKDWDERIVGLIKQKVYEEVQYQLDDNQALVNEIHGQAEIWKKRLSRNPSVDCKVYIPDFGEVTVTLTRQEFDDATIDLLEETSSLCEAVLQKKALAWANVTDVLLVGGSTRMPQVSEMLTRLAGKKPISHVNPDEAVALGAAMKTVMASEEYVDYTPVAKRTPEGKNEASGTFRREAPSEREDVAVRYRKPVKPSEALGDVAIIRNREVQAHGMGIIAVNPEGTAYINETIIPPNMAIPVKSARAFLLPTRAYQNNELEVFVLEGEGPIASCQVNAKYVASGIHHEQGGALVRVQYSFDRNSIIHVQVRQGMENHDLPIRKEPIDPEELYKYTLPIDSEEFRQTELIIVLALDVSGSMSGSPMQDAQKAMCSFVEKYKDSGALIGVVAVSDRAQWITRPTGYYDQCIKAINSMTCGQTGYGNSADPFDLIYKEIANESGERYIIILADGVWSYQEKAVQEAHKCNSAGIETAAIGFGSADKKFLDQVSSKKDLAFLTSQSELTQTFGKIAQSIGTGGGAQKHIGAESVTDTWETND